MRSLTSPRGLLASLLVLSLAAAAGPAAAADPPRKQKMFIDGVLDTGQFLPNSHVLARVGARQITVLDFRDAFYRSDPTIRPKGDSLGRAEYLTNMIRKDVLGQTALKQNYSLNFEDRATLREVRNTALSNRLFQKEVVDAAPIPEDSLRKVYGFYTYDLSFRILFFTDRAEAEAARATLLRNKAAWAALAARHTPPAYRDTKGEIPFTKFEALPTDLSLALWALPAGGCSDVIPSATGYQILQVAQRRPRQAPAYEFLREAIRSSLEGWSSELRRRAITDEAKRGLDVAYDTTNVAWACKQFFVAVQSGNEKVGQNIVIDENVPEFTPADTARTILTYKGGRLSLGDLVHAYSDLPAIMRPAINTPERFRDYADAIILAPRMVDLALQRGLDKDSEVNRLYEAKREELLVTKMVEDSVFTRVMVTPAERRAYYEKNRNGFVTWPKVHYAVVVRPTKAGADSVRARLLAGEKIGAILHADSLAGNFGSGTKEASQSEHGSFEKVLFEELRPGQSIVMGPDREGWFACIQLLSYDPGQQLPYAEVEGMIDESIRNMKAETALNAFTDRLKKNFAVEARYDELMRVMLTTPTDQERIEARQAN